MFNRGYYELGNLPSRQISQRDLSSQSRLKLRREKRDEDDQAKEETTEEKLARLKRELEAREMVVGTAAAITNDNASAVDLTQFDDADDEDLHQEDKTEATTTQEEGESELDAELKREMERVKAEKRMRLMQEEEEGKQAPTGTSLVNSNPLLNTSNSATITRRWDDDVIFRNQARGELDTKKEKRLINDTTRSDVHRQFLKKHIL